MSNGTTPMFERQDFFQPKKRAPFLKQIRCDLWGHKFYRTRRQVDYSWGEELIVRWKERTDHCTRCGISKADAIRQR